MIRFFLTLSVLWRTSLSLPKEVIVQYLQAGLVGTTNTTVETVTINGVSIPWNERIGIFPINIENKTTFDSILQMIGETLEHTTASNHTYQRRRECQLEGNKILQVSDRIQYDGETYLSLDSTTDTWKAAVSQALPLKEKWDRDIPRTRQQRTDLQNRCVALLKRFTRREHSFTGNEAQLKTSQYHVFIPILATMMLISMVIVTFVMFGRGSRHLGGVLGSIVHYPPNLSKAAYKDQGHVI